MSRNLYLENLAKSECPKSLLPFVEKVPVYTAETLAQHLEMLSQLDVFRTQYQRSLYVTRDERESRTLSRLKLLVTHAFESIDHYRKIYKAVGFEPGDFKTIKDFERLPLVSKDDLKVIEAEVRARPDQIPQFYSRTSGSTGVPLCLLNDRFRTQHWHLIRMMMFEDMIQQVLPEDRWIYSIYYETFYLSHMLGRYPTFTIGLNANPKEVADHIRQLKPVVVTGVASQIIALGQYLEDASSLGIRAFTTNSESSSVQDRRRMESLTGVPVLDEYSSEELAIIAWEQRDGTYRVAEDTVHLELMNQPGHDLPSVVGTDLWSFSMPRIRYQQGDFAVWKNNNPDVGPRTLQRIVGRQDMILFSSTKGKIDPALIHEAIEASLVHPESQVEEFRIVQDRPDHLRLLVKSHFPGVASGYSLGQFKTHLFQIFGPQLEIKVELVPELPSLGTKRRCIIRTFAL